VDIIIKIIKQLAPYRKTIVLIFVLSAITAILGLVGPYVYKILTDSIIDFVGSELSLDVIWKKFLLVILIWAIAEFLFQVFDSLFHYYVDRVAGFSARDFLLKAFSHVQNLSLRFHVQAKSGGIMSKINRGADFMWRVVESLLENVVSPGISFIAIGVVIFSQNWKLALIAVSTIPIYIIVTNFLTKKIAKEQDKINKLWEKGFDSAYDAMTNIEAVKAYSGEEYEIEKVDRQMTNAYARQIKQSKLWVESGFYRNLLFIASQISVFAYGGYLAFHGEITIGTIVLFIGYLQKFHAPLYQLTETYSHIHQGITVIGRVFKLLQVRVEIKDIPHAKPIPRIRGEVELRNVSFGYSDGKMILKNIDFKVDAGKIVAVVGPSGVGKSTLMNLLNRFYDPVKGEILIDGIDIKTVQQKSLREQIGIVTQENILFNDTILHNVTYGVQDYSKIDVEEATKVANIYGFIKNLTNRFQTLVGERGVRLSGGEKQRVSIARAILKDPPILILDEATSHLDSENERLVQNALWSLIKGRTVFIIAHRLSTIMKADEIIVIKDGEIVERGKHADLISKENGLYKELYELQASGEVK